MTPEVALTLPWGYIHVYYHSSQISLLVSQVSGEHLQDHWSSGLREVMPDLYSCPFLSLRVSGTSQYVLGKFRNGYSANLLDNSNGVIVNCVLVLYTCIILKNTCP